MANGANGLKMLQDAEAAGVPGTHLSSHTTTSRLQSSTQHTAHQVLCSTQHASTLTRQLYVPLIVQERHSKILLFAYSDGLQRQGTPTSDLLRPALIPPPPAFPLHSHILTTFKPSAGCENCRKAKKRCGLEQPACARCVKLKKQCIGYRDTTQLQIQDESATVRLKAERQKARVTSTSSTTPASATTHAPTGNGYAATLPFVVKAAPPSPRSESSTSSEDTIDLPIHAKTNETIDFSDARNEDTDRLQGPNALQNSRLPYALKLKADDAGQTYFFKQFTADNGHWTFLRQYESHSRLDPVLDLAIKACGIAALDNVRGIVMGREYSRLFYAQALSLLNGSLRDPRRCKTDESLVAVLMLGYFENLTCDGRESIQSWKAHIMGATQLIQLRGKSQLKTQIGRLLFREFRAQILTNTIWDNLDPPPFLWDWNPYLQLYSENLENIQPADELSLICFDFSRLKCRMRLQTISEADAYNSVNHIEMRMIQWSIDSMNAHVFWKYRDIEVPDSPHVWNGLVHAYEGHPAASVWETYRSVRIMISRTQEMLLRRLGIPPEQEGTRVSYYRSIRRQMTQDICAAIPSQLGHAPGYNSPCILITAYGSIWPLFFAGTCAVERISPQVWSNLDGDGEYGMSAATSSALAQTLWIIGRLEYISKNVGLKWADGVATMLRGDFETAGEEDSLPEYGEVDSAFFNLFWREKMAEVGINDLPEWAKKYKQSGKGPRILMKEWPL